MPYGLAKTFTDADAYACFVPATQVQLTIAKPGPLQAAATLIELHQMRIQRFTDNLPRVAHTAAKPGRMIISFRTDPGPSLVWGGLEMTPDTVLMHNEAFESFQRSSGDAAWGSVSIPVTAIADLGSLMAGHDLIPPRDPISIIPPSMAMLHLQKLHAAIAQLVTSAPEQFAHAGAAEGMEQALLEAMVSCLSTSESRPASLAPGSHPTLMRKFHALLEARPNESVYQSEISAALGVSARTMRKYCQEHLGMGLKRYLTLRRLHFVRRALRNADPAATRVTDVATEFGFWELGRFAGAYKSVFGESPSATLYKKYCLEEESGLMVPFHPA